MLPGMDNKVLAAGGVRCELKPQHNGDCYIIIEQAISTENRITGITFFCYRAFASFAMLMSASMP
jgi:hypothetical protein